MIELLLAYKYIIIIPLTMVEGPFVMMISGFLVKLGYLNFILAYILLMVGDLFGDTFWYGLGYRFKLPFVKRFGKFFNITEKGVEKVEHTFHKYHETILFLSKITMGLGFALVTLITAGAVKIPFKKYIFWNALGGFLWTGTLMMIGFFLGNFYLKVNNVFGKLGILSLFIVIFMVLISIARHVRKEILMKKSL